VYGPVEELARSILYVDAAATRSHITRTPLHSPSLAVTLVGGGGTHPGQPWLSSLGIDCALHPQDAVQDPTVYQYAWHAVTAESSKLVAAVSPSFV
jgi:hypothetical protein